MKIMNQKFSTVISYLRGFNHKVQGLLSSGWNPRQLLSKPNEAHWYRNLFLYMGIVKLHCFFSAAKIS